MDLKKISAQCDLVISEQDEGDIAQLINSLNEHLGAEKLPDDTSTICHYLLGNLYSGLAPLHQEDSGGWRTNKYPKHQVSAINHFRQAEIHALGNAHYLTSEIRTNLANEICHQRRNIECLEDWICDFSAAGDAPFVSTLSKARELLWVQHWLNDPGHQHCYLAEAYSLLKKLESNISGTNHPQIVSIMKNDETLIELIRRGDAGDLADPDWDEQEQHINYAEDEKRYRSWCLQNRLFANSLNDITQEWIADQDILQFPDHAVAIDEGPYYSAAFSSLKREFCFARFLAFEGIHGIHPGYENEKLFLTDTLDNVRYEGHIEKLKTAFRVSFSVLDSLATLMEKYFECNNTKTNVYFKPTWIKKNLKQENNPFIDALYWLSCDLTNNPKAPIPVFSEIKNMRNAVEHRWLRVAGENSSLWDDGNDFAYVVSPETLQRNTVSVLKLVRAAMIYFCLAVKYREVNRDNPPSVGLTVPMITPMIQ